MVTTTLKRIVSPCWRFGFSTQGANSTGNRNASGRFDKLLWHKDIGKHVNGEFSMAVVQANNLLEDYSQLESGPLGSLHSDHQGTFIGVYDGHGGPEAARFISDHLFNNIKRLMSENEGMSNDLIVKAYLDTENDFLSLVKTLWEEKPQIASVGSCCLTGVVCNGYLYIANAGDSRVVLGKLDMMDGVVKAVQLSSEHNACLEYVRDELQSLHPDDQRIVVLKHNVWRVKGIIQVSRSIGDAYLKKAEFNKAPLLQKFRLSEPFNKPILMAEPSVSMQKLVPEDQFLIFASDGLWDQISNQYAIDIVNTNPRYGIAKKLVKVALREAAKKREVRYSDLKKIEKGVRRHFHDDISVIVLFLDSHLVSRSTYQDHLLSIRGSGYLPSDID